MHRWLSIWSSPRSTSAPPASRAGDPYRVAIRFDERDVDQARAAGVLIELERGRPIIVDRPLYRELAKGAIKRSPAAGVTARTRRWGRAFQLPPVGAPAAFCIALHIALEERGSPQEVLTLAPVLTGS